MLKSKTLREIIEEKVYLPRANDGGWHNLKCECCSDKRVRAAFNFQDGFATYNCFNCKAKFKYEEGTGRLSKGAREVLQHYGITTRELQYLVSELFQAAREEEDITLASLTKTSLHNPEVAFPDRTYPLLHPEHESLQEPLIEYLIGRGIDPLEYPMYFSLDPKMAGRVIIPFWRNGKLIFWQARAIDKTVKPRYSNCVAPRDAILYNYDQLHDRDTAPLFITEGVFDAMMVHGVSLMGSTLSPAKIELLRKSRRRLIFVIDRDSSGGELGRQVLQQGWEMTFVDVRVSDINASVVQFGMPYTAYSLMKNITNSPGEKQGKAQSGLGLSLGLLEARLRGK